MSPFPCRRPGRLPVRPAHEQSRDGTAVPPAPREKPKRNRGHAPGAPFLPPSRPAAGTPLPAAARGELPDGRGVRGHATDVTRGMTAARVREDLPVTGPGGGDGVAA